MTNIQKTRIFNNIFIGILTGIALVSGFMVLIYVGFGGLSLEAFTRATFWISLFILLTSVLGIFFLWRKTNPHKSMFSLLTIGVIALLILQLAASYGRYTGI